MQIDEKKYENMNLKQLINEYEKFEKKIDKIITDLEQNRELLVYLVSKIKTKFDEKINQKKAD